MFVNNLLVCLLEKNPNKIILTRDLLVYSDLNMG